ncbi:hypothetical protein [Marinigracilibium pacificum]|uniref:STAS/SEC14 domain-containing protein n=1 Tax=Marinigracilibium pacificum TaxID=2729599 RepID=A0A848J1D1_9BACT|nr:hypothetical protein [Marinigracilibium pacificum]NMM50367.1 STAS/SEC14 domain-containing protein [Marinigracilibium pacificum]
MSDIKIITHNGKLIVQEELIFTDQKLPNERDAFLKYCDPNSALVLTTISRKSLLKAFFNLLKIKYRSHVKAQAVIALNSIDAYIINMIALITGSPVRVFRDTEKAKHWLTTE